MMNDGTSGWLSDAQNEFAISLAVPQPRLCLPRRKYKSDSNTCGMVSNYTVSVMTPAHYRGVQGELPFQYWDKTDRHVRRPSRQTPANSPRSITAMNSRSLSRRIRRVRRFAISKISALRGLVMSAARRHLPTAAETASARH